MPCKTVETTLKAEHIDYLKIPHQISYTAQEAAEYSHVSGNSYAKAVIVRLKGKLTMLVLPATTQVNFKNLQEELGTDDLALAQEEDFKSKFPDCELGAIPPFGNLYNMDVYISKDLSHLQRISCSGGRYTESIQLPVSDFIKLIKPKYIKESL